MDIIEKKETTMDLVKSLVGKEVSCILRGKIINKGKFIKEKHEKDRIYLLQNVVNGNSGCNKEDYIYSYWVDFDNVHLIKNLKPLTQSIELWI